MGKRITPQKGAEIRRLAEGGMSAPEIAQRMGCALSTVYKWAGGAARLSGGKPSLSPGGAATPAAPPVGRFEEEPEEEEEEESAGGLNLALIAAGEEPDPEAGQTKTTQHEQEKKEPPPPLKGAQWCVDQVNQIKGMAVFGTCLYKGIPTDHPRLESLAVMSPMAENAVRVSAAELEPWLAKIAGVGGIWACAFWLALDAVGTWRSLEAIAPKKDEKQKPQQKAAPAPEPPPAPPAPTPAAESWSSSIQSPPPGPAQGGVFRDNLRRSA